MAELLLFHHALGLTDGCLVFADELRGAGHVVHAPDLYEGRTFGTLADGLSHTEKIGFGTIIERGRIAADSRPNDIVYAGFSLGILPAQMLAQTRVGAKGAVLMHGCVPLSEFGGSWPDGVPLQLHTREDDELGDAEIAREVAQTVENADLFLYPGDRHLFTDSSLPDYDEDAAALVKQRVRVLLDGIA